MRKNSFIFSIRLKILLGFILIGLLSSLIVGVVTYYITYEHEFSNAQKKLIMIAQLAAQEVDGDMHSQLKEGEEETTNYQTVVNKLRQIKDTSGLEYLYTFAPKNDKKVQFVLDTDETDEAAAIGDEYPEEDETLEDSIVKAFEGIPNAATEIYTDKWGTFLSGFVPIKNSKGEVVAVVGSDMPVGDLIDTQRTLLLFIGIGVFLSVVLSILAALFISYRISRPVRVMVHKLDDVVKNSGDLTQTINIRSSDETGQLANKTNYLLANIREIVIKIRETVSKVNHDTWEISNALSSTSSASEAVNTAIGKIAQVIEEQANTIDASNQKFQVLSGSVNILTSNSDRISKSLSSAVKHTDEGSKAMEDLKEKSKLGEDILSAVSGTVKKLESKSEEIVNIIEVITSISSRTNLLALNAAIEAARAGEQGRGFAVVAEEIRKLAENTTISAKEIASHINDIRDQSQQTVTAMNNIITTMSDQTQSIENTNTVFSNLTATVDEISHSIMNINSAIKNVYTEKEDIMVLVNSIHNSAENMVASSQEINASGEEQHAVIEDIADRVQDLKDIAESLESIVSKFKV